MLCPCTYIDDSYHIRLRIWIGSGIGISISKIFSSALGIESIGKKLYRSTIKLYFIFSFPEAKYQFLPHGTDLIQCHTCE